MSQRVADQAGGWGDSAKCGILSSRQTHGCARDVQMSSIGANAEASSSVGKRIDVNREVDSLRVKSGVPHAPQKLRVVVIPLLPCTWWVPGVPATWRSALYTTTPEANAAPLESWQSRQWQFSIAMGALAQW